MLDIIIFHLTIFEKSILTIEPPDPENSFQSILIFTE